MLKVIQRRLLVPSLASMRYRTIPLQNDHSHHANSHHTIPLAKQPNVTVVTEEKLTRKLVVRGVTAATSSNSNTTTTTTTATTAPQHQPVDVYVTRSAAHVRSWIQTHLGLLPLTHDQNNHQDTVTATAATAAHGEGLSLSTVVGFDVEWRPNFNAGGVQNKTALVQLASRTSALLIQMKPPPQSQSQSQLTTTTLSRRQGLGQGGSSSNDDHRELLQVLGWLLNSPHVLKVTTQHSTPYQHNTVQPINTTQYTLSTQHSTPYQHVLSLHPINSPNNLFYE